MPEEVAVQRTRARPREGQEDVENRLLFSARCRRGRAQCDAYFSQFLETLRAEVVQEQASVPSQVLVRVPEPVPVQVQVLVPKPIPVKAPAEGPVSSALHA